MDIPDSIQVTIPDAAIAATDCTVRHHGDSLASGSHQIVAFVDNSSNNIDSTCQ
jgi:hypothetical protein